MKIGRIVKCDVCGRQVVNYKCNTKFTVGPAKLAIKTDVNIHICHICKNDPLVREQEGLDKAGFLEEDEDYDTSEI